MCINDVSLIAMNKVCNLDNTDWNPDNETPEIRKTRLTFIKEFLTKYCAKCKILRVICNNLNDSYNIQYNNMFIDCIINFVIDNHILKLDDEHKSKINFIDFVKNLDYNTLQLFISNIQDKVDLKNQYAELLEYFKEIENININIIQKQLHNIDEYYRLDIIFNDQNKIKQLCDIINNNYKIITPFIRDIIVFFVTNKLSINNNNINSNIISNFIPQLSKDSLRLFNRILFDFMKNIPEKNNVYSSINHYITNQYYHNKLKNFDNIDKLSQAFTSESAIKNMCDAINKYCLRTNNILIINNIIEFIERNKVLAYHSKYYLNFHNIFLSHLTDESLKWFKQIVSKTSNKDLYNYLEIYQTVRLISNDNILSEIFQNPSKIEQLLSAIWNARDNNHVQLIENIVRFFIKEDVLNPQSKYNFNILNIFIPKLNMQSMQMLLKLMA